MTLRSLIISAAALTLASCAGNATFIPEAPDYSDETLWVSRLGDIDGNGADIFYIVSTWEEDWTCDDGRICHYADVYNPVHQEHMRYETSRVAEYMGQENNFFAPLYRHTTIDAFLSRDESVINERYTPVSLADVQASFNYFNSHRDKTRPFVLAGFSQGGRAVVDLLKSMDEDTFEHMAAAYIMGYKVTPADTVGCRHFRPAHSSDDSGVVICYNTVKSAEYINDIIARPCIMCINPVNWRTDSTPAVLHDTISVRVDTLNHVLIVGNYSGSEYKPYKNFINVGDIHGCEPWLYSDCIRQNIRERVNAWKIR